jgi:glycerol-3-phosphate acyltransferase PlsY
LGDQVPDPALSALYLVPLGYVLGSLPWGYWLPLLLKGVDIRTVGSGNTGATNVWRTFGFKLGLSVAVLDIGKGAAAALLGRWLGDEVLAVLAGVAAMVGHWRPLFLGFARGGKMVATVGGVGLALAPLATLAAVGVWIAAFLATRYASIASMASAATLPLFAVLLGSSAPVIGFTAGAAVAIVVLHRANIARLVAGNENRMELRRRRAAAAATPSGRGASP